MKKFRFSTAVTLLCIILAILYVLGSFYYHLKINKTEIQQAAEQSNGPLVHEEKGLAVYHMDSGRMLLIIADSPESLLEKTAEFENMYHYSQDIDAVSMGSRITWFITMTHR